MDQDISRLMGEIVLFLDGEEVRFKLDLMNFEICSEFQKKVIIAEYGIPRGYISTYGRIAAYIKKPQSSRAVGRALATNPFPIVVPCHRAIRGDGSLGGYQGGIEMKKRLRARALMLLDIVCVK
jgi:methylated-DNA-[protein]-cysteine S-methyltransferase